MIENIRRRLSSKTYIAALVMTILTVLDANTALISSSLPAEYRAYLPLMWAPVMMTLREITNSALSDK
jgi:hypothetical protein